MKQIPNALSALRIAAIPVLLGLAWFGHATVFLWLLAAAFITDIADGYIARRFHFTSELGAKLDSWADLLLYMALPFATWWLWPEIVLHELPFVAAGVSCYIGPIMLGWLRYGRLTSYHTWVAKLTAILMGMALILLFGFDSPWAFRMTTIIVMLGAIEETLITMALDRWHANVPSFIHALHLVRAEESA